ncbi:hypothetical protein [Microvirga sp. VF16]|uniref:hypothetical protein n=1 Tax=Microvirga sp. VF16 TaxID=2807101 RepID=UPI00193E0371|nr:hypothetical protein [Microvirga sp. VF16]QRM34710.1 hypothetical protein JO965_41280 [Microvirga sp. VF16]
MRLVSQLCLLLTIITPALASDMHLMFGLRNTIAIYIRDYGHHCPEVKDFQPIGFENGGALLRVVCGPPGDPSQGATTVFRVIAYTEGDFTVRPWREKSTGLK